MSARRIVALAIAGTAALGCAKSKSDTGWLESRPAPPIVGTDVTRRVSFQLSHERGKVVMLSFGYTSCLELCPDTFATVHRVLGTLGPRAAQVEFAYVTVDPDRDQPAPFATFLGAIDPRFHGIYLEGSALAAVLSNYHVSVRKRLPDPSAYAARAVNPAAFYTMDHSTGMWLIDKEGRLRARFAHDAADSELIAAIDELLRGG